MDSLFDLQVKYLPATKAPETNVMNAKALEPIASFLNLKIKNNQIFVKQVKVRTCDFSRNTNYLLKNEKKKKFSRKRLKSLKNSELKGTV